MLFSGTWEKMIHEEILKQKVSSHCPFKMNGSCLVRVWLLVPLQSPVQPAVKLRLSEVVNKLVF